MKFTRDAPQELGRLVPLYVWITSFLAVFALLLFSRYVIVRKLPIFQHIFWLLAGVLIGALVVVILAQYRVRFWGYRILDPLPKNFAAVRWLFFSVLAAFFLTFFEAIIDWHRMDHILENHGSVFDWFIGSLTIVGIWLTYNTIVETQRIIRSFSQLYQRITNLVQDTNAHGYEGDLHFLAYTASIGYLALQEKYWDQLSGQLRSLGKRLKMICLDDEDLSDWHNHYVGRSTWRQPAEAAHALTLEDTCEATRQSENTAAFANCRKRKNELMPGFYLIFNSRRAIIVAPFFIPPHPLTLLSMEIPMAQAVQMFGFETTDSRIIEDVSRLFNYYWETPSNEPCYFDSQVGSASQLPNKIVEQLNKWTSDPALKGKCLRYRMFVAEEEPWKKILSYLSTKLSAADYRQYLDKAEGYVDNNTLLISVASNEQKNWIDNNCCTHINDAKTVLRLGLSVEVVVSSVGAASGGR